MIAAMNVGLSPWLTALTQAVELPGRPPKAGTSVPTGYQMPLVLGGG